MIAPEIVSAGMLAPFKCLKKGSVLHMGLKPISEQEWVAPFSPEIYQMFNRHKQSVLLEDANTVLVDALATEALAELHKLLSVNLQRYHSSVLNECNITVGGNAPVKSYDVLKEISGWIPDDICLLQPPVDEEEYILTAAAVFSPAGWLPEDKFLNPLSKIHDPVPGYQKTLAGSVNRFFRHISPENPVERYNWSLQQGDELRRLPQVHPKTDTLTPLYFRSERQLLLRLPKTHAVIFLIRTTLFKLDELLAAESGAFSKSELLEVIGSLSAEEQSYKNLSAILKLLL